MIVLCRTERARKDGLIADAVAAERARIKQRIESLVPGLNDRPRWKAQNTTGWREALAAVLAAIEEEK